MPEGKAYIYHIQVPWNGEKLKKLITNSAFTKISVRTRRETGIFMTEL